MPHIALCNRAIFALFPLTNKKICAIIALMGIKFYTLPEVSQIVKRTPGTLRMHIYIGKLRNFWFVKNGKKCNVILEEDLKKYIMKYILRVPKRKKRKYEY